MKHTLCTLFLVLIQMASLAQNRQNSTVIQQNRRVLPATKATPKTESGRVFALGITTNTNAGVIGGLSYGMFNQNAQNPKASFAYWNAELVNVKIPKEYTFASNWGNDFVIGKENYLFVFRGQYGRGIQLFGKESNEGFRLHTVGGIGPSVGIQKPYYIQYNYGSGRASNIKSEAYNPQIHTNLGNVVGSGDFFAGFSDIKPVLGANAKVGLVLELDAFQSNTLGLEIGFLSEYFIQAPVIISTTPSQKLFTSGYLTLFIGMKR